MQPLWAHRRLSLAMRAVTLTLCTSATCLVSTVYAATTQQIHIQQISLDQAIQQLALQTQVSISYDPTLLARFFSRGIRGSFTIDQALNRLLAPHSLEAIKLSSGGYSIQIKAKTTAHHADLQQESAEETTPSITDNNTEHKLIQLPTITLNASKNPNLSTEGNDAYTPTATSASTGLVLSLKHTPQSVSVITHQQIQDQNLSQLSEVITQTAGLSVSQAGNIGSDNSPFYARGQQIDNYLLDGVKLLSSYASIFQSQDTALYDRFEIVRGATGLMTGSGAASASINMVRKKPLENFKASAKAAVSSWENYRAEFDISSPLNDTGSLRGRAVLAYQDLDSYIDRYHENRKVAYFVVESDLGDHGKASLGLSYQDIDIDGIARSGLPSYATDGHLIPWSRSSSAAADWSYSKRSATALFTDLEHALTDRWKLKAMSSRTITHSNELVGYAFSADGIDPITGQGATVYTTRWEHKPIQDLFSLSLTGSFDAFNLVHDLIIGTSYSRSHSKQPTYASWNNNMRWEGKLDNIFLWDGLAPERPETQIDGWDNIKEQSQSIFAATRLKLTEQFSLMLGARLEDWQRTLKSDRYKDNSFNITKQQEKNKLIPYLAISYDFNDFLTSYISHTQIFSPQNAQTEYGDYLDAVIGKSSEIGIKAALLDNQLNLAAAIYRTDEENKAVILEDVQTPNGRQAYHAETAKSEGFEIEAVGKLSDAWQISTSFTHNQSTDQYGQRINTNIAKNMAKLFSRYTLPYLNNALTLGIGLRWQSEIYADNMGPNNTRFTQDSYALVDLMANYKISEQLRVNLNVNNLFNEKYYLAAGNSYFGPPSNFRLALKYSW
ncbi:TonB-dependent siderophore receptor [Acinetobacter rudis]|uniref:TonB-dependent siderophore receptor n=1 Tax=Acinetobacter rudis TaxID=632955 RepID=UPI00333EC2C8